MNRTETYDAAVIGGGVMGCTTALHLARGGMWVTLIERAGLCGEATGRCGGTLSLMYVPAVLVPYAMRGRDLWKDAARWLGRDIGFNDRPGLDIAFTETDGEALGAEMGLRAAAGAPIEIIGGNRAREIEPALSKDVTAAAHCAQDGHALSYLSGVIFHRALSGAGVDVRVGTAVQGVEGGDRGFALRIGNGSLRARRIVLAGGAWMRRMIGWFGLDVPIICRVTQETISERMRPIVKSGIRVFRDISLKQAANGTVLVGGGRGSRWVEDADRQDIELEPLVVKRVMRDALDSARRAVPDLAAARAVRMWTGIEGIAPDNMPVIGPLPGAEGMFTIGCQRSGFTAGPFMGRLLADALLERQPEMPIFLPAFDPARLLTMAPVDRARGVPTV
ncbi:MAG: FAD-binding oxidoreductase [Rhodospirillales bacterium]|jgi:glycine/D-amino acid oxidase-like deaminating enzyme|nr:FAD-binding oxidoreductase [Rhodospirillales bacterium]